jgi:GT2 family glycosyltransferase
MELYVATPCYGCKLNAAYAACLLQLQGECMKRGISMACQLLGNESLVQRARNILIEQFYQSGAKFLLFLDADLAFSPTAILDRLLDFARKHPDAVVTGVYPKKSYDFTRVNTASTEPLHMQTCDFNINIVDPTAKVDDGFIEVLDSATGCMLIPRGVVERMREQYPELKCVNDINPGRHPVKDYVAVMDCLIDPVSRRYLSEDYAFCRRFQDIGGKIYVDLATGMCHIGTHTYEGDIRERFTMQLAA